MKMSLPRSDMSVNKKDSNYMSFENIRVGMLHPRLGPEKQRWQRWRRRRRRRRLQLQEKGQESRDVEAGSDKERREDGT